MKKVVLMLVVVVMLFSLIGCKSHYQDILDNCRVYSEQWKKEGMIARYGGWCEEEQKHYVIFAKPDLDGDVIRKEKYNISRKYGHVVYMYHKGIQETILSEYGE